MCNYIAFIFILLFNKNYDLILFWFLKNYFIAKIKHLIEYSSKINGFKAILYT
jgi:hypothetical protein